MLTIEPPIYQVRGLTFFRDHQEPYRFYCLPGAPSIPLLEPGRLALTLYKYRRDLTDNPTLDRTQARGGGIALVEAALPLTRLELLRADLASASGRDDAVIEPVMFRSASARLILAAKEGGGLVDAILQTAAAPVTSPHRTTFMLALTPEGASLFEQAIRGGDFPAGISYEMRFLALTPSVNARVTMDYERIYDHFSAAVGFTYYVSAKLDLDLAWLIENGFVKIEITSFTDGEDAKRQRDFVMHLVKARIQQDFFRSGLRDKPGSGMAGPLSEMLGSLLGQEVTSASALFVLKAKLEVVRERKTFELLFNGRGAVELTHVSAGMLSTMAAAAEPTIREIDTDDPFFSQLKVSVHTSLDFEAMPDALQCLVHLRSGGHRQSFVFSKASPGPFEFQAPLTGQGSGEYEYSVEYIFDPSVGGGPLRIAAGPFRTRFRALVIDPLAHFRYVRVKVRRGSLEFERVPRVLVHLRIPGEPGQPDLASTTLSLDAQKAGDTWRQRLPMAFATPRVLARTEWEDPRGQVHEVGDEVEVTGDAFVAPDPFGDTLTIDLIPNLNWTAITQAAVEIRYRDGGYLVERSALFTPAQGAAKQTVEIPLRRPQQRTYEFRQIVIRKDGTKFETAWRQASERVFVVMDSPPTHRDVRVVWVAPPAGALGAQVDFFAVNAGGDEETVSVFLAPTPASETAARLPLDRDGRLAYRYQIKRFTETGEEIVKTGEGEAALLVVR